MKQMSPTRRNYMIRLVCRILIFVTCIVMYLCDAKAFEILDGWNFFHTFNVFHVLWVVWVIDMFLQIVPIKNKVALGSQKLFKFRFKPSLEMLRIDKQKFEAVKSYVLSTTAAAYKVMLIASIGIFYFQEVIDKDILLLISVCFYVCDLICVLIWCPFRLIMKNKCCTTCRIFNWDHLMMFSPLVFVGGFYALSLFGLSVLAFAVWEICVLVYPERFCEMANSALKCSECTDKLCTQYCQKLRK